MKQWYNATLLGDRSENKLSKGNYWKFQVRRQLRQPQKNISTKDKNTRARHNRRSLTKEKHKNT